MTRAKRFGRGATPTRTDVLVLFVAPTVALVAIFLYPGSERLLEYEARNPTPVTLLGSNLAHRDLAHLLGNVAGLWVVGGAGFLLSCAAGRKRLYYGSFVAYLLVLPFAADPLVRWLLRDVPGGVATYEAVGFSVIDAALVGFLPLAVGLADDDAITTAADATTAAATTAAADDPPVWLPISVGLFLSGFAVPLVTIGGGPVALALAGGTGLLAVAALLRRARRSADGPLREDEGVRLLVAGVAFFYVATYGLFPPDAGAAFFGHAAGYVLGFLLPPTGLFLRRLTLAAGS